MQAPLFAICGMHPERLLDHDPHDLDSDIIEIWANVSNRERRQIAKLAKALIKDGTNG